MAAENCAIVPGRSVVAVWGCGPVGQFAIRSALLLGAAKVIAIDSVPERRAMAGSAGAVTLDSGDEVMEELKALTGGRGPDASIDAVGMEAHGSGYDQVKQTLKLETDRPFALRQAMRCTRKGGVVSVPGDPSFVITHRVPLSKAEKAYPMFIEKRDNCIKVVLDPAA